MANESIIINQSNLYIILSGRRLTALPATGNILTMERLAATGMMVPGLHNTSLFIVNQSLGRRMTVLVAPNSEDDAWLNNAINVIATTSQGLGVSVSYEDTEYISGGCIIEGEPTRNWAGDAGEYLAYPLIGNFPIAKVAKLSNPGVLTPAQLAL